MVFSADDRVLMENLYEFKRFGAKKLIREFPDKCWNVRSLNRLLKKLRDPGSTRRRTGSGAVDLAAGVLMRTLTLSTSWFKPRGCTEDTSHNSADCERNRHPSVNSAPHHSQRSSAEMLEEMPRPTAVWGKLESCKDAAASIPGVGCWLHVLLRREDLYSGTSSKPPERPGERGGEETRGWCWTTDSCARDQLSAHRWRCLWRCRSSAAPVWCLWSQAPKSTVSTIRITCCQSSYWRTFVALVFQQDNAPARTPCSRHHNTTGPCDTALHCPRPVAPE